MSTVRDVMDAVADASGDGPVHADLYGDLAPLYDFERERMRDHEAIADFVAGHAPTGAAAVGVGACGGGHLLSRLVDRFPTVVGFDASPAMLAVAARRTDAPLVTADLRTCVAPGAFDVFTILGGSIAHLPPGEGGEDDALPAALEGACERLAPGGVLLCDFMAAGSLESGSDVEDSFASDRYTVERTVDTTAVAPADDSLGARGTYTFTYAVTDHRTDETVRVETETPVREFAVAELLGAALNAGFDDATLVSPPTHGRGVVARVNS